MKPQSGPPPVTLADPDDQPPGWFSKMMIILLTLIGIFLIVAGIVGLWGTYQVRFHGIDVPGTITKTWVAESSDTGTSYHLNFSYTADGVEYADTTTCSNWSHGRFQEGMPITVRILKDHPKYIPQIQELGYEGWGIPFGALMIGIVWTGLSLWGVWSWIIKPARGSP